MNILAMQLSAMNAMRIMRNMAGGRNNSDYFVLVKKKYLTSAFLCAILPQVSSEKA